MQEIENKVEEAAIINTREEIAQNIEETVAESDSACGQETVKEPDSACGLETVEESTENVIEKECDGGTSLTGIMEILLAMDGKIEQMNQLFVRKIQHTAHEEKIVDQMHAELQRYKEDMYSQLVRPVLLDIIEIRDSIIRMSNNFALKPEGEQNVPLKTFSGYAFDIQDILEKNSITIYDSKDGDDFNALKQRAIKKVSTPVEQLHGKIAESLSSGYDYMGRTISPEKIAVYIYQKPEKTEGEN